jgi:hypothetical protein
VGVIESEHSWAALLLGGQGASKALRVHQVTIVPLGPAVLDGPEALDYPSVPLDAAEQDSAGFPWIALRRGGEQIGTDLRTDLQPGPRLAHGLLASSSR